MKGTQRIAFLYHLLRCLSFGECLVHSQFDERIQLRIEPLDSCKMRFHEFCRRNLTAPDLFCHFSCGQLVQVH